MKKMSYYFASFLTVISLIIACDKKQDNPQPVQAVATTQCIAGQFMTQYGCLSQGYCPAGQAQYGSQCIVATTSNICPAGQVQTAYGCLAQGSCPVGQAQYQTYCVAASNTGMYQNGFTNNYQSSPWQYYNGYNYYYPNYYNYGYSASNCTYKRWYYYCL